MIKQDKRNYRKHSDRNKEIINKSLSEVGAGRSILIDNENEIIAGNGVYEQWGDKPIKIVESDGSELIVVKRTDLSTEDPKRKQLAIMDNSASDSSEFDLELLCEDFKSFELEEFGVELPLIDEQLEAEEDDFDVPEGGIETDIVLGDLFEIGEHRLLCGDSTDSDSVAKLMNGEKADMVFTSPPYNANTSFNKGTGGSGFGGGKNLGKLYENYDDNLDSKEYIEFCQSVLNNCFFNTNGFIFWNINYNTNSRSEYLEQIYPYLEKLSETIIWKKQALPVPHGLTRTYEFIFVFSTLEKKIRLGNANKTEFNFWEVNNAGALDKSHRAAFPIELPSKAINLVEKTKIVLEPFAGSGSTMVASYQLKRKCYGIEIDPKYVQVIVNRMRKLDPTLIIKKNGELI